MNRLNVALLALVLVATASAVSARPATEPIKRWTLVPDTTLGGRASNQIPPRPQQPATPMVPVRSVDAPVLLYGEPPTDRRLDLLDGRHLGPAGFSLELWILDHVNQPVGTMLIGRPADRSEPAWTLSYHEDKARFETARPGQTPLVAEALDLPRGWKRYWRHIVAVSDGTALRLYHNSLLVSEVAIADDAAAPGGLAEIDPGGLAEIELAGYFGHEPAMGLEHLVKSLAIFDRPISQGEVAELFASHQNAVEEGWLLPGVFHFNAGPYLHMATPAGINIVWESDRPATAVIEFGRTADMDQRRTIATPSRIQEITIDGLEPDTPYFYRVSATNAADGSTTDSGVLTFKTAARPGSPVRFAVMGDPEARPHINARIARLIWNERPDFMLQVGDLTDGGQQTEKFQWNLEYFLGMGALNSRVPTFPVPGNGESDLHWYSRYHKLPSPDPREGYYTFVYGDVQFFMLDSNRAGADFAPGGTQFEWLRNELERSTAKWKIAAHHHPTYSSDEDDYGDTWKGQSNLGDTNVRRIVDLYERHGVDAVFFGHLHTYERSLPLLGGQPGTRGVVHIQAGGGGGNLEDFAPTPTWFSAKTHRGHHFVMCSVHEDTLEIRMYGVDGQMLDISTIRKRTPEPAD
jgi:hypothetical protein